MRFLFKWLNNKVIEWVCNSHHEYITTLIISIYLRHNQDEVLTLWKYVNPYYDKLKLTGDNLHI